MKKEYSESVYSETLSGIRSGDNKLVSRFYDMYRGEFIAYVCREFSLDRMMPSNCIRKVLLLFMRTSEMAN